MSSITPLYSQFSNIMPSLYGNVAQAGTSAPNFGSSSDSYMSSFLPQNLLAANGFNGGNTTASNSEGLGSFLSTLNSTVLSAFNNPFLSMLNNSSMNNSYSNSYNPMYNTDGYNSSPTQYTYQPTQTWQTSPEVQTSSSNSNAYNNTAQDSQSQHVHRHHGHHHHKKSQAESQQ